MFMYVCAYKDCGIVTGKVIPYRCFIITVIKGKEMEI